MIDEARVETSSSPMADPSLLPLFTLALIYYELLIFIKLMIPTPRDHLITMPVKNAVMVLVRKKEFGLTDIACVMLFM